MEETLTDCLVCVREDLNDLKRVRHYLETNPETQQRCSVTWRTIEAFNSILSVCSSQNTPETDALDTLLDSFYYLARNNEDNRVWENFGSELGIICVKILSAIERSEMFEVLFCKLLSVISIICEHNSKIWKAAARQILNVLINKKLSLFCLEEILKLYICTLRHTESEILHEFSLQNLHLLKSLSLLVQRVGDFQIQADIVEIIFLHLSNDTKSMSDFFAPTEKQLFQSLHFVDFEGDCRLYLRALNTPRRGFEKKIYSICCSVLHLGGCFVEPPVGRNVIWVDANKDSERVSIKCGDVQSNTNRVICIQFSEILNIQFETSKTQGKRLLTIHTKGLKKLNFDVKNDDICLVTETEDGVYEFIQFLKAVTKQKKKIGRKVSRTKDSLHVDRKMSKEMRGNAIISSKGSGLDQILPDVFHLFNSSSQNQIKFSQTLKQETKFSPQGPKIKSQEFSPNSFVKSLNRHIGLGTPELRHTFEDSVETVEFLQKATPEKSHKHKLFRDPDKIFKISEPEKSTTFNFIFGENKENNPPEIRTYSKSQHPKSGPLSTRIFGEEKVLNSELQNYFRGSLSTLKKKKPSLPKLKRTTKSGKNINQDTENKKYVEDNEDCLKNKIKPVESQTELRPLNSIVQSEQLKEQEMQSYALKETELQNSSESYQLKRKLLKQKQNTKPSLLDPNGYAFQRWCKPTTSERSNFWLKKLESIQKPKLDLDIFDFSEDSDSALYKSKKKKRVVHSKRKCRTKKETKQTSLRELKEILKNTPPKTLTSGEVKPKPAVSPVSLSHTETSVQSPISTTGLPDPPQSDDTSKLNAPSEPPDYGSECEILQSSEEEEFPHQTKKRERSDEESSRGKKKPKKPLQKNLLTSLRYRLQKIQDKDKRHTDEIIQTVKKATDHLFNHIQRKDGEKLLSYLKIAETVSTGFQDEIGELSLRAKRIQRAILYFRAGCSVAEFCESQDCHFLKLRKALKDLKEKKDTSKTIEQVSDRLNELINSEIDRSIKNETVLKQKMLLRCASIVESDFSEFF